MPLTITATPGSASANSFATVAEADAYIEGRLNSSAWTGTEEKKKALIEATRELNVLNWTGTRATSTQALALPRDNMPDPDPSLSQVSDDFPYLPSDEIPAAAVAATCELAFQFLKAGTTDLAAIPASAGVKRKKTDVLETEYFGPGSTPVGLARFPRVLQLLDGLLEGASAGSREVIRS